MLCIIIIIKVNNYIALMKTYSAKLCPKIMFKKS